MLIVNTVTHYGFFKLLHAVTVIRFFAKATLIIPW